MSKEISLCYTIECLKEIVEGMIRNKQYGHELNTYKTLLEEMVTEKFYILND